MRYAAIIENEKVVQVIDVALHKPTGPSRMVNVERYDVQVGDDYTGGKFWRDGVEVPRNPTGAELQAEIYSLREELAAVMADTEQAQADIQELRSFEAEFKAERETVDIEPVVEEPEKEDDGRES